jgi:radical SAM protein (TIGR01212 family)
VLDFLQALRRETYLWVELGVQSCHETTLARCHTGYTFADVQSALFRLTARGIRVCPHIMLGFPEESEADMLQTVEALQAYPLFGVKLHMLNVMRRTELGRVFQRQPFPMLSQEQYVHTVVRVLEQLAPQIVVHRLTGDGAGAGLLAPQWVRHKLRVLSQIDRELSRRDSWQGKAVAGSPITSM